ncbi:MAG: ferrous iron transport protein B [Oscillospiraceae bacterium]|jgi:ferrous iron transport protein B|nr:ferrous iron transport protein B [Oscillospiraceae bacterium]
MSVTIALAGNPNSGKTTLFNALTGSRQFVGNWPGVTVEKKEGRLKAHSDVIITDLPGIYSLSPYTLEEVIARKYILNEKPDSILNIIDGTNLERNLYLTTQILELGVPVVCAVNMLDILEKRGDKIDLSRLSEALGCPCVSISALKSVNALYAAERAEECARCTQADKEAELLNPPVKFNAPTEKAITEIIAVLPETEKTHIRRFTAIKLFERDEITCQRFEGSGLPDVEPTIAAAERELDDDAESIIANGRYEFVEGVVAKCLVRHTLGTSVTEKIDKIMLNRWAALPLFAVIIFLVYYISVSTVGTLVTDWTNETLFGEIVPVAVEGWLDAANAADWQRGLILDGILAGVGGVLGFVPQMLILFFMLAFLEACGYMARIAFIMDRLFRRFGLSGKSFIPFVIGTGCGVPGIMASRTVESESDRRMTIITTTFMPCGAKLPVIALFAGALFHGSGLVAISAYLIGIASILISGLILKRLKIFKGEASPFVMELPDYHLPTLTNLLRSMWERGWSFIKKAGTIILLSSVIVWFLSSFGFTDGKFGMVEDIRFGLMATIGNMFSWLFIPLGFGSWQATVAVFTGIVAKENIVATLGILYGIDGIASAFTPAAGFAFLFFNLLCPPCFAAIGAIRREMNSARWTAFALCYQFAFAYAAALLLRLVGSVIF